MKSRPFVQEIYIRHIGYFVKALDLVKSALGGKSRLGFLATLATLGVSLREQGITELYPKEKEKWSVKVPAFSFSKLHGIDAYLSPEMKSTGEAIGYE